MNFSESASSLRITYCDLGTQICYNRLTQIRWIWDNRDMGQPVGSNPVDLGQSGYGTTGWIRSGESGTTGIWHNRLDQIRWIWDNRAMRKPVGPDSENLRQPDMRQPEFETTCWSQSQGSDTTRICNNRLVFGHDRICRQNWPKATLSNKNWCLSQN